MASWASKTFHTKTERESLQGERERERKIHQRRHNADLHLLHHYHRYYYEPETMGLFAKNKSRSPSFSPRFIYLFAFLSLTIFLLFQVSVFLSMFVFICTVCVVKLYFVIFFIEAFNRTVCVRIYMSLDKAMYVDR